MVFVGASNITKIKSLSGFDSTFMESGKRFIYYYVDDELVMIDYKYKIECLRRLLDDNMLLALQTNVMNKSVADSIKILLSDTGDNRPIKILGVVNARRSYLNDN